MKKHVTIIGHFFKNKIALDGQTIKTKEIYNLLVEEGYKVGFVDTYNWKLRFPIILIKALYSVLITKKIVFLLSDNGLKFFFPILLFLKKLFRIELYYIVIGGWLINYLGKNNKFQKGIKLIDNIFVESNNLRNQLYEKYKIKSTVLNNFRKFKPIYSNHKEKYNFPLKLCTFSRIMEEKGILDSIKVISDVNNLFGMCVCTLDLYGPIVPSFKDLFMSNIKNNKYVKYLGIIEQDSVLKTLSEYYLLLFPTKFFTEGVPGTIVDAFFAGVPTLSSRWENSAEIIIDQFNGFLFEFGNYLDFKNQLEYIINNPEKVQHVISNIYKTTEKFTYEYNKNILINGLKL